MLIQSILYIEYDKTSTSKFRVGDDNTNNYLNNPLCIGVSLTAGGWLVCALKGRYLAITARQTTIQFMEVMAFSQEFIQQNALTSVLSTTLDTVANYLCTTGSNCQASNVKRSTIVIINNYPNPPLTNCCIYSTPQTDPTLTVTLAADVLIEVVLLTPSDQSASFVTASQKNVDVWIVNKAGIQQLCGTLADYNLYTEVPCKKVGNKIIIKRPGTLKTLSMAGLSILSNCDCTTSSFSAALFTTAPTTTFASVTSMSEAVTTITFNKQFPDTISSVCGSVDGFSKCGSRSMSFYESGILIQTFPYKGFSWNDVTSVGTLNPASTSYVITAQLQLVNYSTVFLSQNITITTKLTAPTAPLALANNAAVTASGIVGLTWFDVASDGGCPVLDYQISNMPVLGAYSVLATGITTKSYTASLLTANVLYTFKVTARNCAGLGADSSELIVKAAAKPTGPPLRIDSMSLNATINEESVLQLPIVPDIKYAVTSIQTFTASVEEFQLKVKSTNVLDLGSKIVKMSATSSLNETANFTVTVNFKDKPKQAPTEQKTSSTTQAIAETSSTDQTQPATVESTTMAVRDVQAALIATISCSTDDRGLSLCLNPAGEYCSFDSATNKMTCGAEKPSPQKTKTPVVKERATFTISSVDSQARFWIEFSEAMNFDSIIATKSKDRALRGKSAAISKSTDSSSTVYLLTDRQLSITLIPGGESKVNTTLTWNVLSITDYKSINIQILFENPLQISSEVGYPDKLAITFLPSSLIFLTAKISGLQVNDPCQTKIKFLATQNQVGVVTQTVESSAQTMETASLSTSISNAVTQIALSQSLAQMWSMVNSLQIILAMQNLEVAMPGNVSLVMGNIATVASFDVIQSGTIIESVFSFSETESPGIGFESQGTSSKRLIPYLGMAFLILLFVWIEYTAFCITYLLKDKNKLVNKLYQKLRSSLLWTAALLYMLETCLDIFSGVFLSLEQTMFETPSDYCDFAFTAMFVPLGIAFTLFSYFFLRKNISKLQEEEFEGKYSCLYEGYSVGTLEERQNAIKMGFWFIFRRLLTAISIVPLRRQTVWIQLVCSMYLTLTDICFKIHLNPYRTKVVSRMEKFNDTIVLILTYFNFVLTDLIPVPENKYFIGWFYVGLVGILVMSNLSVMLHGAIPDIIEVLKQKIARLKLWCANRKKAKQFTVNNVQLSEKISNLVHHMGRKDLTEEESDQLKMLRIMIQREVEVLSEIQEESSQPSSASLDSSQPSEASLQSSQPSQVSLQSSQPCEVNLQRSQSSDVSFQIEEESSRTGRKTRMMQTRQISPTRQYDTQTEQQRREEILMLKKSKDGRTVLLLLCKRPQEFQVRKPQATNSKSSPYYQPPAQQKLPQQTSQRPLTLNERQAHLNAERDRNESQQQFRYEFDEIESDD